MSEFTFDSTVYNPSTRETFRDILHKRVSRRMLLKGGGAIAGLSLFSSLGLTGCGNRAVSKGNLVQLNFKPVAGSKTDAVVVPAGYTAQILVPWGTPLNNAAKPWAKDGSNTALDQANAVGMHHDGMRFFPLNGSATEGLLCINHEYIDLLALHPNGPTVSGNPQRRSDPNEVRKEINAHGVSVVHVQVKNKTWQVVNDDQRNQRITAVSEILVSGPVAGSPWLRTKFSPNGTVVRGTLGNCGNGYTPWGTYLTCEEHWPAYFNNQGPLTQEQTRIGISAAETLYGWQHLAGHPSEAAEEFTRFDLSPKGNDATQDYRNEANGYGYVVEIDPYDPQARPVKRTALGRFRHEGCCPGLVKAGEPVVFYSGHDSTFEYIYKFVSQKKWNPADASATNRLDIGATYMDEGTLYVAKFLENGKGQWLPLTLKSPTIDGKTLGDRYKSLAEILIHTPGAADALGATPMDRPEWTAIDPATGQVYVSLTNNIQRTAERGVNPANPRLKNAHGHIVRWTEGPSLTEFDWDIFVFGGPSNGPEDVNQSGLTIENQFASPDGLIFDDRGILWIQTDNGAQDVASYTNDQMLAVVPSQLNGNDASPSVMSSDNQDQLRRFFVGPNGCEVTGLAFTPDHKTLFVNVQHPSNWPFSENAAEAAPAGTLVRPRASTVVIQKKDHSEIGV